MSGWVYGIIPLLDPSHSHITAALAVGVALFFGAIALAASSTAEYFVESIAAFIVLLLSAGSLLAYGLKTDFIFDAAPNNAILDYAPFYHGRMSADAAMAMTLLSTVHIQRLRGKLAWTFVATVLFLSGSVIAGYVFGNPQSLSWLGSPSRMALMAALGIFTLACGLGIRLSYNGSYKRGSKT
jgi:hypothetical protein